MVEFRVEYGEVTCPSCICAYWKMDESSGDALDATSNGHDLTNFSSSGSPSSGAGLVNTARITDNDGVNYHQFRREDADENCFHIGYENTVFGWIKIIDADDTEYLGFAAFTSWVLYYQTGKFNLSFTSPTDTYSIEHTTSINLGEYYFIAIWIADNVLYFRINNTTVSTPAADTDLIAGPYSLSIASSIIAGNNSAAFDEWGVADRPLTDSELKQLYRRGYGTTYLQAQQIICGGYSLDVELNSCSDDCCDICAYYNCDEASGSLLDTLGNYDLPLEDLSFDPSSISGVVNTARGASGQFRLDDVTEPCFSLQTGNKTFWCWAFDNSGSTGFGAFEKGDQIEVEADLEWVVNIIGDGNPNYVEFTIKTDTGNKTVTIGGSAGDFDIDPDEWYFIVAWVNPTEQNMYLRVKSKTVPANDVTRSTSYAGSTPVGITSTFVRANEHSAITHGLDEMGFVSRILTTTEQDALYNNGDGVDYEGAYEAICGCGNSTNVTGIEILQEYFETDDFQQFWLDCCGNPCECEETAFDLTAPTVSSFYPADNGVADIQTDLVITFNENMAKGTGNILIRLSSDNSIIQTIDVTTAAATISGAVVTIDISDLTEGVDYYVEIDSTALTDLSGNAYAGISGTTTWNFSTSPSCDVCIAGTGPGTTVIVTIDGIINDVCTECTGLNSQWFLPFDGTGGDCIWVAVDTAECSMSSISFRAIRSNPTTIIVQFQMSFASATSIVWRDTITSAVDIDCDVLDGMILPYYSEDSFCNPIASTATISFSP